MIQVLEIVAVAILIASLLQVGVGLAILFWLIKRDGLSSIGLCLSDQREDC